MDNQPHLHGQTDALFQRLRKLNNRLTSVGIEIFGSVPQSEGASPKPITRTVHDKINECHGIAQEMEETLKRLEVSIGGNIEKPGVQINSAAGY